MNESELRQYCLEHAGERLSADAEAYLAKNPEVRKQVEQLRTIKLLVSLKRHEQPAPGSLDRCLAGVHRELDQRQQAGWFARLVEWINDEQPVVAFAYASAALVVCAVGVSLFLRAAPESAVVADAAPAAEEAVPSQEKPVIFVRTAEPIEMEPIEIANMDPDHYPALEKPLIILQVSSNPQPSSPRMSFGGAMSVPVSFEY